MILKLKEVIHLLEDEEKSRMFEESSSSLASSSFKKKILNEVIKKSTTNISFGRTITMLILVKKIKVVYYNFFRAIILLSNVHITKIMIVKKKKT